MFAAIYTRGMGANYNKPKPVDPIWYRKGCYIRIHCGCGRQLVEPLERFAAERGVSVNTLLYELIGRLQCQVCGCRPHATVSRYRHGD